jgi:predicted esterase
MKIHDPARTLLLGPALAGARGALVLVHGRGGSSHDMARLASVLATDGVSCLVPSATGNTWYPRRFLAPPVENEPHLGSALAVIGEAVDRARAAGIPPERIGLAGFSQGACLALEYAGRNPGGWGFVAGLSGARVGPLGTDWPGADFCGAPVLLACAEADDHIPLPHVEATAAAFEAGNARVTRRIVPGSEHRVRPEDLEWVNGQLEAWRTKR